MLLQDSNTTGAGYETAIKGGALAAGKPKSKPASKAGTKKVREPSPAAAAAAAVGEGWVQHSAASVYALPWVISSATGKGCGSWCLVVWCIGPLAVSTSSAHIWCCMVCGCCRSRPSKYYVAARMAGSCAGVSGSSTAAA